MANTSSYDRFNITSALDSAKIVKNVDRDWKRLPGDQAVLYQWFGGMGPTIDGLNADFKHEYVKDSQKPRTITLTADPVLTTTITMSAFDAGIINIGHMLYFTDGEIMRVTANASSTTKTVERGANGSTAAAKATAALKSNVAIGSPLYKDEDQFVEKGKMRGDLASTYPAIIHYKFGETALRSTQRTWVNKTADEMAEEKQRLMIEKANELEVMMLWGKAVAPSSTVAGSFDGLFNSITTNALAAGGAALTLTNLANALQTVRRLDPSGSYTLLGGYTAKRIFDALLAAKGTRQYTNMSNELGLAWDRVHFNGGAIDFVVVPIMEVRQPDSLLLVRKDDVKLQPIKHRFGSGWLEGTRNVAINNALMEEYFHLQPADDDGQERVAALQVHRLLDDNRRLHRLRLVGSASGDRRPAGPRFLIGVSSATQEPHEDRGTDTR